MTQKFDIVIIGGGNAGFGVSAVASEAGKSIAFIEERDFGGTCPNRGCTPKKVLVAAAHAMHEIENAAAHAIEVGKPKLDWAKLIGRKDEMIDFIPDAMKGVAEKRGTVFEGRAKFTGSNTVEVAGTEIEGEHIVIATGSRPRPLPIPGSELMITSDEILSGQDLPDEVIFIGGGVIAMEFSHVYARAGAKVTILEVMPQLLPAMDADAVEILKQATEALGVNIKTNAQVRDIREQDGNIVVSFGHDGKSFEISANKVINGAGRIANVDGLNLQAANVKHDGIRIEVDDYLRSVSNPAVWVAGDALVNSAQLSPLATAEGRLVGNNIVNGPTQVPEYTANPSAVYTVPALATVGLTEKQAVDLGLDVDVSTNDLTGWFSSKFYAEKTAWAKVIINRADDQIVGVHMVGHHGEELIHLFSLAMRHGITATALKETPFAFPTFSSDIKSLY